MTPPGSTLLETADREAAEAEREVSIVEPNAQAGEQGSATQDDDEQPEAAPFVREATKDQVAIARQIRADLERRAHELGPTVVADMLMQCVDIDPVVTFPTTWEQDAEKRYAESDVLKRVGNILLRGCPQKLTLSPKDVAWFWRNTRKWERQGVTVLCEAKVVPPWARDLTDGVAVAVYANFQAFRLMNSLRRVKALYHALRSVDAEARRVPPHFHGWLDELEYFGPMTFEDEVRLVNAIERGKDRSSLPFQLELLSGAADE